MKPVGIAVAFVGYTLVWFGYASVKGPGVGLLDLIIPGRTVVVFGATGSTAGLAPDVAANAQQTARGVYALTPSQWSNIPAGKQTAINKFLTSIGLKARTPSNA